MKSNNNLARLFSLALITILVAACQTTGGQATTSDSDKRDTIDGRTQVDEPAVTDNTDSNVTTTSIADKIRIARQALEEPDSVLANRTIYFDWNSISISDESLTLLQAHGDFIADNGSIQVRLEGHTDERGSREYNIALGERRAQSVRRVLLFQGTSVSQLSTVSYGEEQPVNLEHNETAWRENRRVEIVYDIR